ncbi:hypothetical protein FHS43_000808 [Streptosporangium becharense]|uniref:Uncharacterized protein n=1 Tax=Streptosporangium becharense TaxID=1816182 RepID=A0A7W9IEX7_9ACTN|nr:hypothetical protein [Streptosporangium becharense]MBB2909562.1 hypothetical protein [Streptosporangium becharense]MBB5819482.1 hypothetical protein [Streptosporangium becharense]
MKRHIAGLACAATAVLSATAFAPAAHASAQAADPITALNKQLTAGHGVRFVDTTKMQGTQGGMVLAKRTGTFQFGASGISASDQTTKLRIKASDLAPLGTGDEEADKMIAGLAKPERVIRVRNTSYISGGLFGEFMPEGKTWLQYPGVTLGVNGQVGQLVNVAEPATLRALLARATVKRPTSYAGKITFGELYRVSPWFRASLMQKPSGKAAKTSVNWKLSVGADQLSTRLVTSYPAAGLGMPGSETLTVDTRYSGWGSKVTITAPPADQIAKPGELGDGVDTENPIPLLGAK